MAKHYTYDIQVMESFEDKADAEERAKALESLGLGLKVYVSSVPKLGENLDPELARKALDLRRAGKSYFEIREELDVRASASALVQDALEMEKAGKI